MNKQLVFGHFCRLTVALALSVLVGCKNTDTKPDENSPPENRKEAATRSGFACCNLHYEGDWISDSNLAQLVFIPAGTRINVKKIDGYRAYVEVDGKPMRLGHDYGREQETTEQWVNKLVVVEDPVENCQIPTRHSQGHRGRQIDEGHDQRTGHHLGGLSANQ